MPIITNLNDAEGSNGITLRASWVVIDGLAFWRVHHSAIEVESTASHVTVQNCEMNQVGSAVAVYGEHVLVTHNYFHDGKMIHITEGGNDDYGANGVVVSGSYLEISYNRAFDLKDYCPDFGDDGGFIELYGGFHDVNISRNIVSETGGFVEGGSGHNEAQDRLTFAYKRVHQQRRPQRAAQRRQPFRGCFHKRALHQQHSHRYNRLANPGVV